MAIKNHKSKNLFQRRKYRRPHQKYGTGTLINNFTNPAQIQVPEPLKRRRKNPRYSNDNKSSNSIKINKKKRSKKNRKDRSINNIIGGCNSKRGAIPWHVILSDMNCGTLCGGTQINLRFILTAAHCNDAFKIDARKHCPRKIKKGILHYPHNIQSKYVLYFCCYLHITQSRNVHIIIIGLYS